MTNIERITAITEELAEHLQTCPEVVQSLVVAASFGPGGVEAFIAKWVELGAELAAARRDLLARVAVAEAEIAAEVAELNAMFAAPAAE